MKKKRLIIAGFVVIGVAVFVAVYYLGIAENPQYVRAAKGLDESRARAKGLVGETSWGEYREARGTVYRDDADAWESLSNSIPVELETAQGTLVSLSETERLFRRNRQWFLATSDEIKTLVLHHADNDKENNDFGTTIEVMKLSELLWLGIIGAGYTGDIDSLRTIGSAASHLVSVLQEEPDFIHSMVADLCKIIQTHRMIEFTQEFKYDKQVTDALIEFLDSMPERLTLSQIFKSEVRSHYPQLSKLLPMSPEEVNEYFNEMNDYSKLTATGSRGVIIDWVDTIADLGQTGRRRVGPHTVDALEARYWEVTTDVIEDAIKADSLVKSDVDALLANGGKYDPLIDQSYEFVFRKYAVLTRLSKIMTPVVSFDLSVLACKVIARFTEVGLLPDDLPSDLMKIDLYSGRELIYEKTATGFLIYSVGENNSDDGFYDRSTSPIKMNEYFTSPLGDIGIVVEYPVP